MCQFTGSMIVGLLYVIQPDMGKPPDTIYAPDDPNQKKKELKKLSGFEDVLSKMNILKDLQRAIEATTFSVTRQIARITACMVAIGTGNAMGLTGGSWD